jgi:hypothetical protein
MTNTASRGYPGGDLRASDADRDRALAELSEHFQAGRLTVEELDERSGQALRARTGNDLAVLLADLPPGAARAPSPPAASGPPAGLGPHRPPGLPVARVAILAAIVAVVIAVAAGGGHIHGLTALLPVLIAALIVRRLVLGRPRGPGRGPF